MKVKKSFPEEIRFKRFFKNCSHMGIKKGAFHKEPFLSFQ